MITVNNVELRNLQEQVLKNKQDIAQHYNLDRVMADFGIKVVGKVANASELPDPATYVGDYGSTYAVGTEAPYKFYVWTRADINSGHETPYWFDYGTLSIIGPAGPQGTPGPRGATGRTPAIYSGNSPQATENGDLYINTTNGNLYQTTNGTLVLIGNIKGPAGQQGKAGIAGQRGPQGPQGPQGPKGDPGAFIHITTVVENTSQLPPITELSSGALVGPERLLYIPIGETTSTAVWTNLGPINVATLVSVEGNIVGEWNADTKVDKADPEELDTLSVYGVNPEVGEVMVPASAVADQGTIAIRNERGSLNVASPQYSSEAVNKYYGDQNYAPNKPTSGTRKVWIAGTTGGKWTAVANGGKDISNGAIPTYVQPGEGTQVNLTQVLVSGEPKFGNDVATKDYVDRKAGGGTTGGWYHLFVSWYNEEADAEDELDFMKYNIETLGYHASQYVGLMDYNYNRYLVKRYYPGSEELYIEDIDNGTGQYVKSYYINAEE